MIKVGDTLPAATLMEFSEVEGNGCSIGPNPVDVAKATAGNVSPTLIMNGLLGMNSCDCPPTAAATKTAHIVGRFGQPAQRTG